MCDSLISSGETKVDQTKRRMVISDGEENTNETPRLRMSFTHTSVPPSNPTRLCSTIKQTTEKKN
jgi:hypothetical protein